MIFVKRSISDFSVTFELLSANQCLFLVLIFLGFAWFRDLRRGEMEDLGGRRLLLRRRNSRRDLMA